MYAHRHTEFQIFEIPEVVFSWKNRSTTFLHRCEKIGRETSKKIEKDRKVEKINKSIIFVFLERSKKNMTVD